MSREKGDSGAEILRNINVWGPAEEEVQHRDGADQGYSERSRGALGKEASQSAGGQTSRPQAAGEWEGGAEGRPLWALLFGHSRHGSKGKRGGRSHKQAAGRIGCYFEKCKKEACDE